MQSYDELMSAIQILIDANLDKKNTEVQFGVVSAMNSDFTCSIVVNGISHTLPVYGGTVVPLRKYPVVVPSNNFSQAFVLGESKDSIIAQGTSSPVGITSGNWTWRKYANGDSECHGTFDISTPEDTTATGTAGAVYTTSNEQTLAFPTGVFNARPSVNMTMMISGLSWLSIKATGYTNKDTLYYRAYAIYPVSQGSNLRFSVLAKGKWR